MPRCGGQGACSRPPFALSPAPSPLSRKVGPSWDGGLRGQTCCQAVAPVAGASTCSKDPVPVGGGRSPSLGGTGSGLMPEICLGAEGEELSNLALEAVRASIS